MTDLAQPDFRPAYCDCRLCTADSERRRSRAVKWLAILAAGLAFTLLPIFAGLARGADAPGAPPASVVKIGGCSGVCVDPSGVILTVKHGDHGRQSIVEFPEIGAVATHKVYESPETDGTVVFVADSGGPFPSSPLASAPPAVGSKVYSWAWPANGHGARNLTYGEGSVSGSALIPPPIGLNPLSPKYRVNLVPGLICDSGWSGGPLFNEAGEVCGLCSSGSADHSCWIGFGDIRTAVLSTKPDALIAEARTATRIVDVYTSPGCAPCEMLKMDVAAGKFAGCSFQWHEAPEGMNTPTIVYLEQEQVGYFGPSSLQTWFAVCEKSATPDPTPVVEAPTPRRRTPVDDLAAVRVQVSELLKDIGEFKEAGVIGKVREINDLRADIAATQDMVAEAKSEWELVREDYKAATDEHPWYYGVPAVVLGVIKRRYLNRGAAVEV